MCSAKRSCISVPAAFVKIKLPLVWETILSFSHEIPCPQKKPPKLHNIKNHTKKPNQPTTRNSEKETH